MEPGSARAVRHLARALAEHGRLDEALVAYHHALRLNPRDVSTLAQLARLKKLEPGDSELATLEALAQNECELDGEERIKLFFTLGRVYEQLGDYERSFDCLRSANRLKRATLDYDVEREVGFLEQVARAFDRGLLGQLAGAGSPARVPILIVGMPRSGTTLVEQIVASHPAVHGGGELGHLGNLSTTVWMLGDGRTQFPAGVRQLSAAAIGQLGSSYLGRLNELCPTAERVTDKNPLNFQYLGLARIIVPGARVIHCIREPADTCMSCYALSFRAVDFAYDLQELGLYYRAYAALMEHWRAVLPAGWMLEVRYEDVVDDPEREARRLIEHCGLDWTDACLAPHQTRRHVETASLAQVRQPVYRESVARWRRYASHLEPLLSALGPYAPR